MARTRQEDRVFKLLIAQIPQVPAEKIREIEIVGEAHKSYTVPIAGGYMATLGASEDIYTNLNRQRKIEKRVSIEIESPEREEVFYCFYSNHLQSQKEWYNNLRETYLTLQRMHSSHRKIVSMTDKLRRYQDELNALEKALLSK